MPVHSLDKIKLDKPSLKLKALNDFRSDSMLDAARALTRTRSEKAATAASTVDAAQAAVDARASAAEQQRLQDLALAEEAPCIGHTRA
jgi:hypothetical protein